MANLRSLRHLYLHGCYNLRSTPANIGQLTSLRTLPMFVVGKNIKRHGINQLRDLDLEGGLSLMGLGHVKDAEDAKRARIVNKQKLTSLALSWELSLRTRLSNSELVLDALRPHSNIEALSIDYYEGNRFPHWIKGECLPNLSCLSFICCKNCQSLPPLGELPSLEYLKMCQLKGVKRIGDELYGHNKRNSSSSSQTSASFPKLEELKITDMSNLEEWTVPQEIQAFPCLLRLSINGLPKLKNFSGLFRQCSMLTELELVGCNMLNSLEGLQYLTRLEKLKIHTSNSLKDLGQEDILSGLASLQELTIESCYGLVYLSEGMKHLTLLKKLHISGCENLEALPEGMGNLKSLTDLFIRSLSKLASIPNCLQHLTNLEELTIVNCEPMVSLKWVASFPRLRSLEIDRSESLTHLPTTLEHATSLERLKIGHCQGIEALPEWIANLSSLRIMDISYCPNIKCLPDAMRRLTTLESLWIFGASPELMRRCKKGEGEDWYKIEHIPYSSITG